MSGQGFEVVPTELRAAAKAARAAGEQVACWTLPVAGTGSFGSAAVAAALQEAGEAAATGVRALQARLDEHASSLEGTASVYEAMDARAGGVFRGLDAPPPGSPFGSPFGAPFGTPFGQAPAGVPLGPPSTGPHLGSQGPTRG